VTRTISLACLSGFLFAAAALPQTKTNPPAQQNQKTTQPGATNPPTQLPPDDALPPEEDESVKPKVYTFDPLEADRNIRIGNFYMHRGRGNDYRAALGRYEDATKYNPNSAEAFFKVGEAEEKLKNKDAAKIAFEKVIQLAPDSKLAHDARKKIGGGS
jgi:tetratricopeptide (TPR) repeat protein